MSNKKDEIVVINGMKLDWADRHVEWFGIDGALCLLYACVGLFLGYGMLSGNDYIVGFGAPLICFGITTAIFLKYCTEVLGFATGKKKTDKK